MKIKQQKRETNVPGPVELQECSLPQSFVNANRSKNMVDLDYLVNYYEQKLSQMNAQEIQMQSTLSLYFTKCQLKETENKSLRDQLKVYAQKSVEVIELNEKKILDVEKKLVAMTKSYGMLEKAYNDLIKVNATLVSEKSKLEEQYKKLKQESEQVEKENEDTVFALQKHIETESALKKDLQHKLKEIQSSAEQQKNVMEAKFKEFEVKLESKESQLSEKTTQLAQVTTEFEGCKSEVEKLKTILSYVKNAVI